MSPERMAEIVALARLDLSGAAWRVLIAREALLSMPGHTDGGQVSPGALIETTGLSRASVFRALAELKAAGFRPAGPSRAEQARFLAWLDEGGS